MPAESPRTSEEARLGIGVDDHRGDAEQRAQQCEAAVDRSEQDVEEHAQGDVAESLDEVGTKAEPKQHRMPQDVRRGRRRITPNDDPAGQDHLAQETEDDGKEHRHAGNARVSRKGKVFADFRGKGDGHGSR